MALDVKQDIMPLIKQLKTEYQADAWIDDILGAINRLVDKYTGAFFTSNYERLAQRTVSMQEAKTTSDFLKSVNRSVGVDISAMMSDEDMSEFIRVSTIRNVDLIRSIPEDYFDGLRNTIIDGMAKGLAPSSIAVTIQKRTGIQSRRARFIARDQMAKLNSDVNRKRMKQTGATLFKWVTSKDERVGSDHKRAANRETKYGKGIYSLEKGAPEGFPGNATRPNCRCTMQIMIPGVNYFPEKER